MQPSQPRRTALSSAYVTLEGVGMKLEKLTLRLEDLIVRAKRIARERGTSVSRMVAGFDQAGHPAGFLKASLRVYAPDALVAALDTGRGS